jgi:hypothetical protein
MGRTGHVRRSAGGAVAGHAYAVIAPQSVPKLLPESPLEYIPLSRAAILAHERLFPDHAKDARALDVLALALSAAIPIYQRDAKTDAVQRVADSLIAAGRFTRGATRLEIPHRPPLGSLVVSRADLARALETLVRDSLAAARLRAIWSRTSAPPR